MPTDAEDVVTPRVNDVLYIPDRCRLVERDERFGDFASRNATLEQIPEIS